MEKKELWRILLSVEEQFFVDFCGKKIVVENGMGFIEKNDEKKISELPCIALYAQQKKVILKLGVANLMLDITRGNIDDFVGEYELSFWERKGFLTISRID